MGKLLNIYLHKIMESMLMGLDPQTLSYLGYSIAALASMGLGYWATKDGITSINLSQSDIQLIA